MLQNQNNLTFTNRKPLPLIKPRNSRYKVHVKERALGVKPRPAGRLGDLDLVPTLAFDAEPACDGKSERA